MPRNVEVKARLADFGLACAVALRLSGREPQVIEQHDIFFAAAHGRVKLRAFSDGSGELIEYDRPDTAGIKTSCYQIARTSDAATMRAMLANMGAMTTGEVRKERRLYLIGQTRVHLDRVERLGEFLELEVVLRDDQTEADGEAIAAALASEFGLTPAQMIVGAYVDLLPAP